MDWKFSLILAIFSSLCFCRTEAESTTVTAVTTLEPPEVNTTAAIPEPRISTRPCYVVLSRVSDLIVRLNQTARTFNRQEAFLQCHENQIQINVGNREVCTEDQILAIEEDLAELAGRLVQQLTDKLEMKELGDTEVFHLEKKKSKLFENLQALRVFYGPSPCGSSSITLYPFRPLVDQVETSLNKVMLLLTSSTSPTPPGKETTTTTAAPPPPPLAASSKTLTTDQILSGVKSYWTFQKFAQSNTEQLNAALPDLVSQLYNSQASNFDQVFQFINNLPSAESKIIGFSALYDEIPKMSTPPTLMPSIPKLVQLADALKRLNESSEATLGNFSPEARSKLDHVLVAVRPFTVVGVGTECEIRNAAYPQNQLFTMGYGWPESAYLTPPDSNKTWKITPQIKAYLTYEFRYGGLLIFASDTFLNTHRLHSSIGFRAQPSERYILREYFEEGLNKGVESDWSLVPVENATDHRFRILSAKSKDVMVVHETAVAIGRYRRVVLVRPDHIGGYNHVAEADQWILDCRRKTVFDGNTTMAELLRSARRDPGSMTSALPELVPRIYKGTADFDQIVKFIKNLPSVENKVVGYSALYRVIERRADLPSVSRMVDLADAISRLQRSSEADELSALIKTILDGVVKDLRPLILIGAEAECNITNAAYLQKLATFDAGWPQSTYLRADGGNNNNTWKISPNVITGMVTFKLKWLGGLVYVADENPNMRSDVAVYRKGVAERYILRSPINPNETTVEVHWKLVPVGEEGGTRFKILGAKYNDVVVAHSSAMGSGSKSAFRRVVAKRGYASGDDGVVGSDQWILDCERSN